MQVAHVNTSPMKQLSQDEAKRHPFTLWLGTYCLGRFRTDREGYIDIVVQLTELSLSAGEYEIHLRVENVVSGSCYVCLLAPTHQGLVVRSDLDLTYLDTDFQSASSLAELLFKTSKDRVTIPGMATLFQQLELPIVFLSGSPKFFKRTIEGKLQLDGVLDRGLVLKPYKELLVRGLFRPTSLAPVLKEQVGFKLARLLRMRTGLPAGCREILLGDDSEADHVVYTLYSQVMSGDISIKPLLSQLKRLGVARHWLRKIRTLAPLALDSVLSRQNRAAPLVAGIFIRQTGIYNDTYPIADWLESGLIDAYTDTTSLVDALHQRSVIDLEQVKRIKRRL
jgi:phosphatidate phosphatase APP1